MLERVKKAVERLLHFMVSAAFLVLIFACVLQVFTRFVLNNSLSWTEELARYAFIWRISWGRPSVPRRRPTPR